MDVGYPVHAVIPSLEGPTLMVLAGTTAPLSLSTISRLAGAGSISGVRKALLRLVRQGVVLEAPGGYLLNREHLAAAAVIQLARLRTDFNQRIAAWAQTLPEAPILLGLFGSYARKDGDEDSDIDILFVSESLERDTEAGELADLVQRWTGNDCHVVTLTRTDLHRMHEAKEPILSSWNDTLQVITGDPRTLRT